ncbi:MAG: VWA domain-containing protein [Burkholderiaceae bacterium]|nr:VWA domain-containing protein [Burkholderiaceae bacterium]
MTAATAPSADRLAAWRERLDTRFEQVDPVFEPLATQAAAQLRAADFDAWLDAARALGKLGRGVEPMLVFLEEWPAVVQALGGDAGALPALMQVVEQMQKSPNGRAIAPFLQSLPAVARRLPGREPLQDWFDLCVDLMRRTSGSIHGHHTTFESPGLPAFLGAAPRLLDALAIDGLRRWVDYGVRNHGSHPQRQVEYFSLASPDSRAVLQRERHGTLFADVQRRLELTLRALWGETGLLVPYSTAFDELRQPVPYFDALGLRVPDVMDDLGGVSGLERYRAVLAHMAAHRRWSTVLVADNWSPFQRLAVEFVEDARVDVLIGRRFPGLRRILLALHPRPRADACDDATTSCLRHRLAMLSRALLDPAHGYADPALLNTVARFHAQLAVGDSSTRAMAELAMQYVAQTRRASDQFARVHFDDTVVSYRDDNRHLWRFIEEGDEEEVFDPHRRSAPADEEAPLPPRLYPEWDEASQSYRPDWVSVYDRLQPAGDANRIDRLLARHAGLARQLKRRLDLLKPQDRVRTRFQEDGSELDLDVALRSLVDLRAGHTPDVRINMSHRTDGRSIAVLLLLDLSASLNQRVGDGGQTLLELSQEAVALLAWAIDQLGDRFAIAGFASNTRHEVRYQHILGFSERWGTAPKARLAALQAGYSTRMGAALRHGAHYLGAREADKKLLLILTDGEPSDVDVADPHALIADTRQAVKELDGQGIHCHAISLDPNADRYAREIFGHHFTVIDRVEQLPERMPKLFMSLTR